MRRASVPVHSVYHHVLCLLTLLVVAGASGVHPAHARTEGHLTAPGDTLAIVGRKVITAREFASRYAEKVRTFGLSDNGRTREGYLANLVEDELLIARSRIEKLDRTPEARSELSRIQTQALLNAWSAEHLEPAINVTEADLQELFRRLQTRVNVRHLYASSRSAADSLYAELSRGRSFEELARTVFKDPRLRDSGGSLGLIGFDEMDPAFEDAAFTMEIGAVSRPVKTVEGYSIIRVDGIQRNPLATEIEFLKSKDRLRRFARKRRYEEAVTRFTQEERVRLDLRFDRRVLSRLFESLQPGSAKGAREAARFSPSELHVTAVRSRKGAWDLGRTIRALSTATPAQQRWIRTVENLEDVVAGFIIREQIVRAARTAGISLRPSFLQQVSSEFETYLLTTMEERLRKQLAFSEDTLRAYYRLHEGEFRGVHSLRISAILLDSDAAADTVARLLQSGAAFADVAKAYSIQRATAERGGDAGTYTGDQLENLQPGLSRLSMGQWAGPVAQGGQRLFVACTGRTPSTAVSFEDALPEIARRLVEERWPAARKRWVESLKNAIMCRIYPERLMAIHLTPSQG